MPSENVLRKYARLAVLSGINIQKGQLLVITCPVDAAFFARLCKEEAYQAGAGQVKIRWTDEESTHLDMLYADVEVLKDVPEYRLMERKDEQERKCAYLNISSSMPGLLKDCDTKKIAEVSKAVGKAMRPYSEYTRASKGQWSIAAVPNAVWAKRVFPDLSEEDAVNALWDAILKTAYVSEDNDPIAVWVSHSKAIREHCQMLNEYQFKELHFHNAVGTDLHVPLAKNHIWGGGEEKAHDIGVYFEPNIPTEEVFTTPSRTGVHGTVVSSKPLSLNGHVVENFSFTFQDGKVIDVHAEKGEELLKDLIQTDECADRLGEVALISYDSPISRMNLLFYNTLFDENASCHLALGASYPSQIEGGVTMSDEELMAHDANVSSIHVDFMFGTKDMHVDGIKEDGTIVPVFRNGNFVF